MNTGKWQIMSSEVVARPIYRQGEERKDSDIFMNTTFMCPYCRFCKSWIHKKGVAPVTLYNFCPYCGEDMAIRKMKRGGHE